MIHMSMPVAAHQPGSTVSKRFRIQRHQRRLLAVREHALGGIGVPDRSLRGAGKLGETDGEEDNESDGTRARHGQQITVHALRASIALACP